MAQSAKGPTLDFGSGYDLAVLEFEPHLRLCADSMGPAWDSLPLVSLSLSAPPLFAHSLSKINKHTHKKKNEKENLCSLNSNFVEALV